VLVKILYVTKQVPFGGTEAFLFPEIESHLAAGWDVRVAPVQLGPLVHARGMALLKRTLQSGLLSGAVLGGFLKETLTRPKAVLSSLALVVRRRPSVLMIKNLAVFPKGVWLGRACRDLGIEHIHAHWIAVPATMAMIAGRIAQVPMSITAHRYDIAQRNLLREKFRDALFVRAIDRAGARELLEGLQGEPGSATIIHMGVDGGESASTPRTGALTRMKAVIAARLQPKKGHEVLLRAIAQAKARGIEVELDIIGEGKLLEKLERLVVELKLGSLVRFCGIASHEVLLSRLRSNLYDCAVLPSLTAEDGDKEGIPVFLMEAMAAGLPVISTNNGGIPELIGDNAGLLVAENSIPELANALIALAGDESLRHRLANGGKQVISRSFSIVHCCAQLRDLMKG
jgi:glycosyltransferase involved in cell wall biosynthesis